MPAAVYAAVAAAGVGGLLLGLSRRGQPALRLGRHTAYLRTDKPFVIFIIGHQYPSLLAALLSITLLGLRGNPLRALEDMALKDPESGLLRVERRAHTGAEML